MHLLLRLSASPAQRKRTTCSCSPCTTSSISTLSISILSSSILPPPLILLRTPLAFVLPSQVLRFWRVLATNLACHLAQLQRIGHKSRLKVVLRRSCRQSSGSSSEPSNGSKYRSGQEVLEEKTCTVKSIIALQSLHLVSEGRSSWQRDHPWNWWHMALDGLRAYRVDR